MSGNKDAAAANAVIAWLTQQAQPPAVTSAKLVLGTTAPTATSNMTQLSGTGSTPQALAWTTPSGESASNSGAVANTNGSGSSWSVAGLEEWNAALAVRYIQGVPTGGTLVIANGNVLQFPVGAITYAES